MSGGRDTDKHAWDSYAELMAKQNGIQRTRGDASPYAASTTRAWSPSEASSTGKPQKHKQRGSGRSTAAPNPFLGAPANSRDIYTIDAVQDENSLEDVALDTNVRDAPRGFGSKQGDNTVRVVVTDEGSQQRDARIDQLARTVAAQEREIKRLRGVAATNNAQKKTFPPCYPIVRQHIREDIPSDRQYVVRIAFFNWCLTTSAFLLNMLVMFLQLVIASGSAASFILAALIAAIGIPVSWLGWYKNLYRSQITDAGSSYVKFFVHGFIHILWCIFSIVGPNLWSTGVPMAGILNIGHASDGGIGLVVLNIIVIAFWGLSVLVMLSVFKFANSHFRNKPPPS